jgi:PAS domain S-box-containing protein
MNFSFFQKFCGMSLKSLQAKIILLTCSTTFATAMFIGVLNYFRTLEITQNKVIDNLAGEARTASLRFKSKYDEMRNDVFIISRMPSVSDAILNPHQPNFKKELAAIFISVMKERSHYQHLQFISLNSGYELLRVNRVDEKFEIVDAKNLQEKSREPYFQEVVANENYRGTHISKTTYDKNKFVIDMTLPVFCEEKLCGMLVINADYDAMFARAFKEIALKKDAFLVNDEDEHMEYYKDRGVSDLKFHHEYDHPDFLDKFFHANESEMTGSENNRIFYGVKFGVDEHDPSRIFGIVLMVPRQEMMKEVYVVRNQNIILGTIILILSLLATILVTKKLTRPLKIMTREVIASKKKKILNLPIFLQDEIGELARAFKEKTENLFASEEKMRIVMNSIVDGIITVNHNGEIDSYSGACKNIFGYDEEKILGKNFNFLLKNSAEKISDLIGKRLDFTGVAADGREFPLEVFVSKILLDERDLFCCVVRDISERKQIENMKNEFISTVNHEIRTPLTSIQGSLGLLRMKLKKDIDEKNKKLLDISYSNCERLTLLVNDILDIEKIAAGKMEYNFERVEICEIVQNIVERNLGYAQKYDVKFVISSEIDKIYCNLDINRFGQALTNLLSNAAKFSHAGDEVVIALKLQEKNKIKISVSDKGDGIPLDFRDKIFQKFSQADSSSTRKKSGTGLGLSIAKAIVEALGGVIGFDSKEGAGTTFYIILPTEKNN